MTIYLGTQGWSYKDWVGPLYPPGTPASGYLVAYAQSFDAVELDSTFYGTPRVAQVAKWNDVTPPGFQFTAKVPREITHDRHLIDARPSMEEFLSVMRGLGDKLGAVLIQMPPDFTYDERPALEQFLQILPDDIRFAAEFRHRSWLQADTYDLLRGSGVAWTVIDLSFMPTSIELTADFTYVRWLGNRKQIERVHETQIDRTRELTTWAERLEILARKTERIYGFVNNHYSGHSPADVRFLRRRLGMPEARPDPDLPRQGVLI